jgi:hypothetical protein
MRRIGQILIGLSVAAAVGGGLFLAVRMNERGLQDAGTLGALLFVVVTGLAAFGIYVYVRGDPSGIDDEMPRTETELARRLSDALGNGDRVSFQALADALDTDSEAVARLLSELTRLEVLPAAIDWKGEIIYPKNRGYLLNQRVCLNCSAPLTPDPKLAACSACQTIHYDV